MRWVLRLLVLLVICFCAYWWGVKSLIESQSAQVFDAARQKGIEASAEVTVTGFPARFDVNLQNPSLDIAAEGFSWSAPSAQLHAVAWAPWHMILALPQSQSFRLYGQEFVLNSKALRASLRLSPLPDLPLKDLRLSFDEAEVSGQTLGAGLFALRHAGGMFYQFGLDQKAVSARALGPLPAQITQISGNIMLELDQPLNRQSQNPLLQSAQIEALSLIWGALEAKASGELRPDAQRFVSGKIEIEVKSWELLPDIMSAAGVLPESQKGIFTAALRALPKDPAEGSLKLPLSLNNGQVKFGFFTLGRAPLWP